MIIHDISVFLLEKNRGGSIGHFTCCRLSLKGLREFAQGTFTRLFIELLYMVIMSQFAMLIGGHYCSDVTPFAGSVDYPIPTL